MIVHYKNTQANEKRLSSSAIVKVQRRKEKVKKLTKANKDFLKALGFKV